MTNTNQTTQLELGFKSDRAADFAPQHREQRLHRAKWWFAQMRRVVNNARVWQPIPQARPEQTWLPGQRREIRLLPQQQVCE